MLSKKFINQQIYFDNRLNMKPSMLYICKLLLNSKDKKLKKCVLFI